jgi:hypothetical protein
MRDDVMLMRHLAKFADEFGAKGPFQVASIMEKGALAGRDWTDLITEIQRNAPDLFYGKPQKAKRRPPCARRRER